MTIEMLKSNILTIVNDYPIKRITLFGSRAAGTDHEDSDVDLSMEFSIPNRDEIILRKVISEINIAHDMLGVTTLKEFINDEKLRIP